MVADVMAREKLSEVYDQLINDTMNYFNDEGVNVVYCLVNENNPLLKSLKKHGFINCKTDAAFSIFPLEEPSHFQSIMEYPTNKFQYLYGDYDEV